MQSPGVKYGVMGPPGNATAVAGGIPGADSEWNSAVPGDSVHLYDGVYPAATDAVQRATDLIDNKSMDAKLNAMLAAAHQNYNLGRYKDAQTLCEAVYRQAAYRTDNLLLLGAVHFQLRNFSECILYNEQCIRLDNNFAEAYSNLGNALKELGDVSSAVQFYLRAVKLKPRFCDAYNNLASAYLQLGQTQDAIETYQMALVLNPGLVDAHSNLGNLYKAQGMLTEAKRCYLEAIRIKPSFSIAWSNLAGIFKEEGNLTTAVAYYREAIRLCPDFADAHSNLGNVLKEQGLIQDAMQCYQTAIKLRPDFAIAYGNLASCYYDTGCLDLAIRTFRYAIQLEPNFPDAYNNLGNALRENGQLEEAINCYRTTLRLKADHPHAYNNLGNAMKDKGLIKEAIHCYMTAVRLMPKFAAVHSNLGSVLKEQGKLDAALAHYQEAIKIDPNFADAYSNMGNAFKEQGKLADAIKCYSAAINIKPTFADAFSNLASAYKEGGDVVQAITCYRKALSLRPQFPDAFANLVHSLVFVCDWSNRDDDFAALKEMLDTQMRNDNVLPSVQPFHAMAYPLSAADMQQICRKYAQRVKMNVALLEMPSFRFHRKPLGSRVKVGYVSSDLGNHPLSHLMQSVFGMHDRSRFEVKCYALSPNDDSVWRRKIEGESEHFCDISAMQNGEAARLIHADGIDVLINLNGYTKGARNEIFALQPAPIQVSYLGFCGTLGADYIQYMIADHTVITPETRQFYTEKILYMPHSYFVNDHKQSARCVLNPSVLPTRASYGVPEDKFVLCNFNQLYKMDPEIFSAWMSVLKRVPNAVLWLLRFPPAGENNIRMEARKRGVRDEQLHFTDVASKEEHIKRGYLADLFLDTPSCNAHTTGCDILWSGTPLLTMAQSKMATRVAPSLLKAAGAEELIVDSHEEYEEVAVRLATDPERLFQIRKRLEEGRHTCPLFDTQRWVQNMEEGLMMAYERHEAGLPPHDMSIKDVGTLNTRAPCGNSTTSQAVHPIAVAPGAAAGTGSATPGADCSPLRTALTVGPHTASCSTATAAFTARDACAKHVPRPEREPSSGGVVALTEQEYRVAKTSRREADSNGLPGPPAETLPPTVENCLALLSDPLSMMAGQAALDADDAGCSRTYPLRCQPLHASQLYDYSSPAGLEVARSEHTTPDEQSLQQQLNCSGLPLQELPTVLPSAGSDSAAVAVGVARDQEQGRYGSLESIITPRDDEATGCAWHSQAILSSRGTALGEGGHTNNLDDLGSVNANTAAQQRQKLQQPSLRMRSSTLSSANDSRGVIRDGGMSGRLRVSEHPNQDYTATTATTSTRRKRGIEEAI